MTVQRPPVDRPSAPKENQCFLSNFLTTLGAQEETDGTSMLWSIDSCQNKVSADQYHLAVSGAQVSTYRDRVHFWSYPLTTYWFSNDRRLKLIFFKFIWKMLCLCHYGPALLRYWFETDLGRQNSASFLKKHVGKTFSRVALIGQNLTGEFMQKINAASWKLFTLTAEADRVLSQLVMFLTIFFHWMYKVKYSCYREYSVIHG